MEARESEEANDSANHELGSEGSGQNSAGVGAKPPGTTITDLEQAKLAAKTSSGSVERHRESGQGSVSEDPTKHSVSSQQVNGQERSVAAVGTTDPHKEMLNNTTQRLDAQAAIDSVETAEKHTVEAEVLAKRTQTVSNEFSSTPTLEPTWKRMPDCEETAVGPISSATGTMATNGGSTPVALPSGRAATLLSTAVETEAPAMETRKSLPEKDFNGGSRHSDPSSKTSPTAEQRNPPTVKSKGVHTPNDVLNASPPYEEEEDDLPTFADEESIALYGEIRDKQRLLSRQGTELGQKAERVVLMRQHLQQLKAEADHLENLVAAKEAHIKSDKHMEEVAVRQSSKLKTEVQQQQQQQHHLQSRLTALQVGVAKGQEQMDCFKLRMKWNEEELSQWRSAAHQKEEDLACLAEFKKKDDARAAGLMAQAQRASTEVNEAKKRLQEEQTAARAARAELQRSLEYFAEQQKDRALLIAQG